MITGAESQREVNNVVSWRREQLVNSGFSPALAARLVKDERYGLRALLALLARGCRPELAAQILAPPDGEDAA